MLAVLNRELHYTALKQLLVTAAVISLEKTVLNALPLGFSDVMHGYFRVLCVGYALYAVGNTVMLILLYFYRLFRCIDGVGIVCGFDGCVHSNRTVLHYVAVRFRFSDGGIAVRHICDIPARLIHRQSAIPSAGATADCGANETWTFHRTGHTA